MNLLSAPAEGIRRGMSQAVVAAQNLAHGEVTPENVVGLIEAKAAVKANAASLRANNEIVGTILDTFA